MATEPLSTYRDNPLWELIQSYMDDPKHRYPPLAADLARETGISEQVLSKWKARPALPSPISLLAFSQGTGIDYQDLLQSALAGRRYLPGVGRVRVSPRVMRKVVRRRDWVALVKDKSATVAEADYWADIEDEAGELVRDLQNELSELKAELRRIQETTDPTEVTRLRPTSPVVEGVPDDAAARETGQKSKGQLDREQ